MRALWADLLLFARSFWPDWISRMGGIGSVALLFIGVLWDVPIKRWHVFLAAAICYVIASFRVWQRERRNTEKLANELDQIYADVILDWLKQNHLAVIASQPLAGILKMPEYQIVRGLNVLETMGIIRKTAPAAWTIPNPILFAASNAQFRRLPSS